MEANPEYTQVPDSYPDNFTAIDVKTGHEYFLEGIDIVFDKEKQKPVAIYKASISKRGIESD